MTNKEDDRTCGNCATWESEWQACFGGDSPYCSQFTKPDHSCWCWQKKVYKGRLIHYSRKAKCDGN